VALTCYGIWRWHTYAEGIPGAEKLLENLLSNSIRWLVTSEDERPVRIHPTKEIYSGTEPVEFTAQVYDDNYAPIENVEVSVLVSQKGETSQLTLTPLRDGLLEGAFETLPEGDYTYTARALLGGTELARQGGSFTVGGLNAEFLETRMNKSLLQQLAARTGGTYYDPAELGRLPADLAALPEYQARDVATARSFELWNRGWMLALMLAVFSVEWFLRKRNGMM
jgi:hypothetical protein